jgi:hypothetical protein
VAAQKHLRSTEAIRGDWFSGRLLAACRISLDIKHARSGASKIAVMSRRVHVVLSSVLVITGFFLFIPPVSNAQALSKRLILKDGSYQLATKWEKNGDRVRYYSSERQEWEEVPDSLIDWPATEKFEKDRASGAPPPEAVELDKELEAERKAEELKSPQVAPGLRLPDEGGVLLLDNFQGQPQLNELQQTGGDINKNMKGNILRAAINPIASAKQTIEIPGAHAKIQSHVALPTIYVNATEQQESAASPGPGKPQQPEQPELPTDRFKIIRMQVKADKRIAGDIKIKVYGKVSQEQKLVPTTSRSLTGGWQMVTPAAPLAPGEYAVVEMLGKEGMNLYVWDFGVNPSAPANASAWKPDPREAQPKPDKPSDLQKRDNSSPQQ